jgi:hypothetical protein
MIFPSQNAERESGRWLIQVFQNRHATFETEGKP